jgi:AbrB family looped-hinge helix DNA binding protein
MSVQDHPVGADTPMDAGVGTVDDKGRVVLPKTIREALNLQPGSTVAYLLLDHALLFIPQDDHLNTLLRRAAEALTGAGLSARDLLDALPRARAETVAERYGSAFLAEMEQLWKGSHPNAGDDESDRAE